MAAKKSKVSKASKTRVVVKKNESFFSNRPYLTIVVLATLVCALAFTVELIHNALQFEAYTAYTSVLSR